MMLDHDESEFAARLAERLRRAPTPPADDALLARIHETLARGTPRAGMPGVRRWPRVAVVAAAALVLAAVMLRPSRSLTAGAMSGRLQFEPSGPLPGQTVRVRYEPNGELARFDHVRLRARFRSATAIPSTWFESQVIAARLERDRTGTFVGSFVFPDSAVFGAFAVEDDGARYVDSNRRSLWTLLVTDSTGTPTFEALEQRINDVATTNWELALATARRATALHPDQVRGWVILLSLQQSILSRAGRDSAVLVHRGRLPELDERAERGAVSSDELGAMVSYAEMLGDTVRAARWGKRLARSNPRGVWGINAAMEPGYRLMSTSPRAALVFFDSLWQAAGGVHPGIGNFALTAAQMAKDSAATTLWFHRALTSPNVDTVQLASGVLGAPGLADEAAGLLRDALRAATRSGLDGRRALELTREAARPAADDRRAFILSRLADALAARGQSRASVETLALAAAIGWDPELYHKLARGAMALGDTARALDALAHVAADPATAASLIDSARTVAGRQFDAKAWDARVAKARAEMRERMLGRSERTSLPQPITVVDAAGRAHRLSELVGGRPTLVAFWSMGCPYSVAQHGALSAAARRLEALGFHTIALTHDRLDSAMVASLAGRKLDFVPYRDQNNEARLALAQWGTPEYFVLDGKGRLRFRLTTLASAAAQLASVDE